MLRRTNGHHTPEDKLCKEREIVPDMRKPSRQGQKRRRRDKHEINHNDRPLAALNCAPMVAQAFPERVKPAG
jgi:hypothetical protein